MYLKREKIFIFISSVFSGLHALGYIILGVKTGFNIFIYLMLFFDLLYIPVIIKRETYFPFYFGAFSCCLVFILAFTNSRLYNNYSALLCAFIGILLFPKYKRLFISGYLIAAGVAFSLAEDPVYFYLIHISRALWLYSIYDFILYERYNRKPVILYDAERQILEQLTKGKLIKQIELNGYSERTIRRRLEAAKKRNGIKNTEELKELFIRTYKK